MKNWKLLKNNCIIKSFWTSWGAWKAWRKLNQTAVRDYYSVENTLFTAKSSRAEIHYKGDK